MTRAVLRLAVLFTLFTGMAAPMLAKTIELDAATIADINAAFDAGTLTAEKLVQMCLARIEAYDRQGPKLHAVITLNPKALETARALDAERKAKGRRSPLHGIPVVLKDNFDTFDMPTTGGSVLLEGSIPPDDAFVVKKLREAGAIILAKVNLSEFAMGPGRSSLGGQSRNPHDLTRTPSGSSGGTGVAIAAGYAIVGLGSDTGGSIRGPATADGVVGLKPTNGLLSHDGIIPLALTFDTGGPLSRHVYDLAAVLGVMTGIDPADDWSKKSEGKFETDYTKTLKVDALKGARIGVGRDFLGADGDVDWVIEAALDAMKRAGATLVDVRFPRWVLDAKGEFYSAMRMPEFRVQMPKYLATLKPGFPKTIEEMIERSNQFTGLREDGAMPNPSRWTSFKREAAAGSMDDYRYTTVRDYGIPAMRATVDAMFTAMKLDAIVYPPEPRRPGLIAGGGSGGGGAPAAIGDGGRGTPAPASVTAMNLANVIGFPDLVVPAGFTGDALPVGLSFFGQAFSEAKLLSLAYSFEQATKARRRPVHTPALKGETISVPDGKPVSQQRH